MALKLNIPSRRKFAAIDFDSRRLRVLSFAPGRGGAKLQALVSTAMGDDVDMDSPESIGAFLAATLAEAGLAGCRAVMTVPRRHAVLKPLSLPAGTPEDQLPGMVQFQIGKELPFPAEDAVVDFDAASHFQADSDGAVEEGVSILAAAVRLPQVDFYRKVAEAAGIRLERLGLRPYAVGRCVGLCVRMSATECVAMVNVTADETEIAFFVDGDLVFSRAASFGMPDRSVWPDERRPAVQRAVRELTLSMQSYQAADPDRTIDAVLVAGDTGLEDDIRTALADRFDSGAEQFNPARALGLTTRSDASAFAAALGAAMDYRPDPAVAFDFLAPKRPVVHRDTAQIKVASIVIAAVVALIIAAISSAMYRGKKKAESMELSGMVGAAETRAKKLDELIQRVQTIEGWERESIDWLGHWAYLSKLFPPPTEAYIDEFRARPDGTMKFTVRARTRDTIEQLQNTLAAIKGYQVNSSRVPPSSPDDLGLGYMFESVIDVRVDRKAKTDLTGPAPQRPADDGSLTMLPAKARSSKGRSSRRSSR